MPKSSDNNETDLIKECGEWKALYNSLPIGLCVLDRSLRIIRINESLARIDGIAAEEHLGKAPREVIPFYFSEKIESLARSVVETGKPLYHIEFSESPVPEAKGARCWIVQMIPIRADDSRIRAVNVAVEDITERKKAEKERARLTSIMESTSDLVATSKPDGSITYMNASGRRMLGWDRDDDLFTHNLSDAHPERFSKAVWDVGITAALARGVWEGESTIIDRHGREMPVSQVIMVHRSASGEPEFMSTVMRNISGQKQAEERLRESEARFRSYFELPIIGIAVTSLEKGWIEANDRLCEILGYTRDELVRLTWSKLTHPDDLSTDVDQFNRVLSGEMDGYSMEKRYRRKDGKYIWASISVRCVRSADGKPDYFIGVIQDITERKKVEEELNEYRQSLEELVRARTVELEEKNKKLLEEIAERIKAEEEKRRIETQLAQAQRIEAIDRFAGGIAHDINNILYPIIINLEELLDQEPYVSSRRDILHQTLSAAHRQGDLVKKILSFSRKSERVVQPIAIRALLAETVAFLKSTLPSTISIQLDISAHKDIVMGDSIQIQQVIMNLCQNAADAYASQKGTIWVGLANARMKPVHGQQDIRAEDGIELTVKDTGMGMTPEVMDRIFEPFFTNKEVGKGTGMGLSVAHGIVLSHGGTITVESAEGKGSLFTVRLPVSDMAYRAQAAPADNIAEAHAKQSILLVDDEEIILTSLSRALSQSGYRVTPFQDGQKALQRFNDTPDEFDLVITDLTMPGMTGLELSQKILGIRPDIPIILSTGYNDIISQEHARSLGIRELLNKPASTIKLKKAISRALEIKSSSGSD